MDFQRTNTKISLLEDYYSHFDEDHRLQTRHGQVEFFTSLKYIHNALKGNKKKKVLDIGAGTGAYSCLLSSEGYDVTALELVSANIEVLKNKNTNVKVYQGNAIDLSRFEDNSFDVTLVFGPMYHLLKREDKIKALEEAKRVTKNKGKILISYYMNDYAIISRGFIKKDILNAKKEGRVDENFHVVNLEDDLYSMVRLEDINSFNKELGFKRFKVIAQDGFANYIRTTLNSLSSEEFDEFITYHLSTCEREDMLGYSAHLLDIVRVVK